MLDFKLMKINKLFTDFNLSLFFTSFKRCIKWPDLLVFQGRSECTPEQLISVRSNHRRHYNLRRHIITLMSTVGGGEVLE